MGAAAAQIRLAGLDQCRTNTFPPAPTANGQPIHVPSPPIPGSNQSANDLGVSLGNQESSWGVDYQPPHILQAVNRRCMHAPRLRPQL